MSKYQISETTILYPSIKIIHWIKFYILRNFITTVARTIVLVIIDGFGIAPNSKVNAISQAHMPTWEYLNKKYSSTQLDASGNSVGLPTNIMGNSEVGHLTIGSGRINFQSLELINRACVDGSLERNDAIRQIIQRYCYIR